MPSPFPGMDPYLESPLHWGSVHLRLNGAIEAQLNRTLPKGFVAELDTYVWLAVESPDDRMLLGRPDAFVTPRGDFPADDGGGVAVEVAVAAEPTSRTKLPKAKKTRRSYVKVTTADGAEVLAVVELLSPSNKSPGPDRDAYLMKRGEYLAAGVNLLEVDLLRDGGRLPLGAPSPPASDYIVALFPKDEPGQAQVWAFDVRDRVPVVPLPFRTGLTAVAVDLRASLDRAYDDGRYRDKLRYGEPCDPPLRRADAEWAATHVLAAR